MTERVSQSLVDYLMNNDDLVLDLAWRVRSLEDQLLDVLKYLKPKYTVQYLEDIQTHIVNDEWLLANNIMKTLNKEYIGLEAEEHMEGGRHSQATLRGIWGLRS